MAEGRTFNPKVALLIGALVLIVTSAIAIFTVVSYSPQTTTHTPSSVTTTAAPG